MPKVEITVKLNNGERVVLLGIILQYSISPHSNKIPAATYLNWFLNTSARNIGGLFVNILIKFFKS